MSKANLKNINGLSVTKYPFVFFFFKNTKFNLFFKLKKSSFFFLKKNLFFNFKKFYKCSFVFLKKRRRFKKSFFLNGFLFNFFEKKQCEFFLKKKISFLFL